MRSLCVVHTSKITVLCPYLEIGVPGFDLAVDFDEELFLLPAGWLLPRRRSVITAEVSFNS